MSGIRVWTWGYFPITMGGRMWRPMATVLDATGPHELGRGFRGFLVTGPDGVTAVAEAQSGAIVGDNLESVRADITACGSCEVMRKQVEYARTEDRSDEVELLPEEWWQRVLKARSET